MGLVVITFTYIYDTVGDDVPPVISLCPLLLSLQVFLIPPNSQTIQTLPKLPIQPMSLLCIGGMRITRAHEECWWLLNNAGGTEASGAVVEPSVNGCILQSLVPIGNITYSR